MFNLQQQIKRNTDDIHSYVADIGDWQKDMNAKEKQIREDKIT